MRAQPARPDDKFELETARAPGSQLIADLTPVHARQYDIAQILPEHGFMLDHVDESGLQDRRYRRRPQCLVQHGHIVVVDRVADAPQCSSATAKQ